MARTEVRGGQVKDSSIQRDDLDSVTTGQAVVRKLIQGTDIALSSTGVDAGTGDVTVNGAGTVSSSFALTGVITPAQITADQNDYNPTGLGTAVVVRLSNDGNAWAITGIAGGTSGRVLLLHNSNAFVPFYLVDESSASTAANRIRTPNLIDVAIPPLGTVLVLYDGTASRWHVIGEPITGASAVADSPGTDQDNYAVGVEGADILQLTPSANITITGIQNILGKLLTIHNLSAANSVTLPGNSTSSTIGNRFAWPTTVSYVIPPGGAVLLQYDKDAARWYAVGGSGGAGFSTTAPSVVGPDAAAGVGSSGYPSRLDHQHGVATYASTPAAVGTGAAGTSGTAPSRGDHVHPTGAGTPSTQAFGDSAVVGSGPAASMTDHKHAFAAIAFSIGGTILSPTVANVIAWRAPFACTVTALKGYRVGGTGATVNAGKGTTAVPTNKILASDLSLTSSETWQDGGAVQNTAFAAGDPLVIIVASLAGTPTEISVQVDYTRP